MKEFQVAYIPIGVPTYELVSAEKKFEESAEMLNDITEHVVYPDEMLLSLDKLKEFLDHLDPDLIVLQNITFANAAYATEVLARFDCPFILWTLREPVIDGTRLHLNSLTGAYSAANTYKQFRKEPLDYVFGAPDEVAVQKKLAAAIQAARLKLHLKNLTMASIGHTPQGFGFGRALDAEMRTNFGVNLECIEARELIHKAKSFSDEDVKEYLEDAMNRTKGLENTPEQNRLDFARLYRAYKEFVDEHHIGALASRCWPDFFTEFGTPVCMVLSILNDLDVPSACEVDAYGALSMYMGRELTGRSTFFGDPVSMDEKEGTVTFWHCGMAACSLARTDTGAEVGEHCNRHIGPTMEFGCKAEKEVTIFRVGKDCEDKFRFLIAPGEALDKPKQFYGTSIVVRTDMDAKKFVEQTVTEGWEPHFVVIYGNVADELEILGHQLNIPVERLG
ncbi:MAG: fucose isomerase [Lachnospiraceae bacterium]|nr:fucose isomerase [Lachnospiraceae bacterium]